MAVFFTAGRARRRAHPAGFTLIEIMCVMVIMAIAAAIVFAGMSSIGDLQADSAARSIMADLLYAQNRAIATQSPVYITFNTTSTTQNGIAANTYALCSALSASPTFLTNPVSHANYTNTWTGQNWTISSAGFSGQTAMYFDQLGTPWSCTAIGGSASQFASPGTVTITCNNKSVTITIQTGTGDMTVQ